MKPLIPIEYISISQGFIDIEKNQKIAQEKSIKAYATQKRAKEREQEKLELAKKREQEKLEKLEIARKLQQEKLELARDRQQETARQREQEKWESIKERNQQKMESANKREQERLEFIKKTQDEKWELIKKEQIDLPEQTWDDLQAVMKNTRRSFILPSKKSENSFFMSLRHKVIELEAKLLEVKKESEKS